MASEGVDRGSGIVGRAVGKVGELFTVGECGGKVEMWDFRFLYCCIVIL
jgi:hypothetical protein